MAGRYDSRTTTFSPEGRLYQVEYAIEAIAQAGAAVGIKAKDGVVLAAEKRITSKLLDKVSATEKMYKIDDHVSVAVAGITSDANILINRARIFAQQYTFQYNEPMPVEQLVKRICDVKQMYTQFGGYRPFGVSFLVAGWDSTNGFQLYQSDPSGNFAGWKARAIGANNPAAQTLLKEEYKVDDTELKDALALAVKVLSKTMDTTTPSAEKLEFATVTYDEQNKKVVYKVFTKADLEALLKTVDLTKKEDETSGDI